MITQYIQLGDQDWGVLVCYNVQENDLIEVEDFLKQLDCTKADIHAAIKTLSKKNTGFTYSNSDYKMSLVCVGRATNVGQFVNTCVHEAKHVQSHVCSYYRIEDNSEDAAYLMGYIVQRMYDMLEKILILYLTGTNNV